MSLYQVNKFLRDVSRSAALAQRCRNSLSSVLEDYDLTPQEKGVLERWQIKTLYEMGVNPLLLLTSSMAMGQDMRSYVAALRENK
jgi:hypothetical protein